MNRHVRRARRVVWIAWLTLITWWFVAWVFAMTAWAIMSAVASCLIELFESEGPEPPEG